MNKTLPLLGAALEAGVAEMGLALSERQFEQLLRYLMELDKWNRAYNLSAVRDVNAMVSRHILDSLSVLPHLRTFKPATAIDVGTGAGLPGIPLAIAFPECRFTLLDSAGKIGRLLFHVYTPMRLDNLRVAQPRVEAMHTD